MKKIFNLPKFEIVNFETEDVLAMSNYGEDKTTGFGKWINWL